VLSYNDLRQRIQRLAALWLQSPVSDEHELARIVTISEFWHALPKATKIEVESLISNCQAHNNQSVHSTTKEITRES